MAELMRNSGSVYAFDVDADRHALLKESMKRLKLNSVNVEQKDATADSFQVSDKILIDAPCTGTGVMAKRADLKWRRHPSDLDEMVAVQKRIISHIAQFLESEGELVYATCSVEPEENWGVVDSFLADNPSFSVQSAEGRVPSGFLDNMGALSTFPPEHGMDGVFAVILKRN
jgi:16S rRNA (cytosine967-C5)-methyltransferase